MTLIIHVNHVKQQNIKYITKQGFYNNYSYFYCDFWNLALCDKGLLLNYNYHKYNHL